MRSVKGIITDKEIIQKLWQAFRFGHSTYIAYVIGLINFTLILYRLAGIDQHIEPVPFALLLIAIVLPAGVIIGWLHIKKQLPTEAKTVAHNNPYMFKVIPDSKEVLTTSTMRWNLNQNKVTNDFISFQSDMNKKLWLALNEISGKEIFTKEDMEQMDRVKQNAETMNVGVGELREKYKQLLDGKTAGEIDNLREFTDLDEKDN